MDHFVRQWSGWRHGCFCHGCRGLLHIIKLIYLQTLCILSSQLLWIEIGLILCHSSRHLKTVAFIMKSVLLFFVSIYVFFLVCFWAIRVLSSNKNTAFESNGHLVSAFNKANVQSAFMLCMASFLIMHVKGQREIGSRLSYVKPQSRTLFSNVSLSRSLKELRQLHVKWWWLKGVLF